MSHCLKSNLSLLEVLIQSSPRKKKAILCSASDDLIKVISEIVLNTLKGNIPLTPHQICVLKKGHKFIKSLSSKSVSFKRKKLLLKEAGGFISPLLSFALLLITGLLVKQ